MKSSRIASWFLDEWRWLVASVLGGCLVLGTIYSVVTPIWEGPDELGHYRHVRFLVTNLSLPGPGDSKSPLDELTHPPLYYAVTAVLTSWVDTSDNLVPTLNPFAATGIMEGGVNKFLHSNAEAFPYRGTALAVHMARLVSVLIGTLVVFVTYRLGRLLFPERPEIALGAMALNAFTPSFLFMSGMINNDIMVTLFCSLTLLFSVKVVLRGPGLKDLLAVGVFTGFALLSKYNALALVPVVLVCVGVAVARKARHRRSLAMSLAGVFLLLLSGALISSWWFLRSVALFGAPTTRSTKILSRFLEDFRDPVAGLSRLDWSLLPDGLKYFYTSFWASFGWGNISAADWVYRLLGVLCLAGLCGLVVFMLGRSKPALKAAAAILLLAFVSLSLLAIYRTLIVNDPVLRGRYALPAISGVSVLLSLGVVQLTPRRLGRLPILLAGLTMLFLGFITPFRYIAPVYARPPIVTAEEASLIATPLDFNFGDKVELLGYELDLARATPGQFIPLTLYWRPLAEMNTDYTVGISLLGPDGDPYGQVAAYPGHGNYPTSIWNEGEVIEDTYSVRVNPRFPAPSLARIYVALYTYPQEEHLPVLDPEGTQAASAATFGELPVGSAISPSYSIENPLSYDLAGQLSLLGYDLDDGLFSTGYGCITLYWEAQTEMAEDYTVFVHVVDEEGQVVAQSDSMPISGLYPTSYWQEGEIVPDEHCLRFRSNVRPVNHQVFVGMYQLETMQRLAVFDATGSRVPNDQSSLVECTPASPSKRLYVPFVTR